MSKQGLHTHSLTRARSHSHPRRFKLKKVVGGPTEFTAKGITIKAHAFTESARAAIEGSGGTCIVLPKTAPLEGAEGEASEE